tara:strand:+ start:2536 stop:2724 length:189 start_codon:yes stop_codon:yes gene_type:complete
MKMKVNFIMQQDAIQYEKKDFIEKYGKEFESFFDIIHMYEDRIKFLKKAHKDTQEMINNYCK